SFAPAEPRIDEPEIALPFMMPVEVITVDAERTERNVEMRAVGRRRARRIRMRLMMAFVRDALGRHLPPEQFAAGSIVSQYDELIDGRGRRGAFLEARIDGRRLALPIGRNRSDDEDTIAPDDRRRAAAAFERGFPADIRAGIPVDRRIGE